MTEGRTQEHEDREEIQSDAGPIVAVRQRGGPWRISHPSGDLTFWGDRNQVRAQMRRFRDWAEV